MKRYLKNNYISMLLFFGFSYLLSITVAPNVAFMVVGKINIYLFFGFLAATLMLFHLYLKQAPRFKRTYAKIILFIILSFISSVLILLALDQLQLYRFRQAHRLNQLVIVDMPHGFSMKKSIIIKSCNMQNHNFSAVLGVMIDKKELGSILILCPPTFTKFGLPNYKTVKVNFSLS